MGAVDESLVPVLLEVLGGEQGAVGVVAAFHKLEQEGAEAFLGRVMRPSLGEKSLTQTWPNRNNQRTKLQILT